MGLDEGKAMWCLVGRLGEQYHHLRGGKGRGLD